jgi:hypothetical protein
MEPAPDAMPPVIAAANSGAFQCKPILKIPTKKTNPMSLTKILSAGKSPIGGSKNMTNFASGFTGGNIGNSGSGGYRGGQLAEAAWNRLRTGGTK